MGNSLFAPDGPTNIVTEDGDNLPSPRNRANQTRASSRQHAEGRANSILANQLRHFRDSEHTENIRNAVPMKNFPIPRMQQPEIEAIPEVRENPLNIRARSLKCDFSGKVEFVYDHAVPVYLLISVRMQLMNKDGVKTHNATFHTKWIEHQVTGQRRILSGFLNWMSLEKYREKLTSRSELNQCWGKF